MRSQSLFLTLTLATLTYSTLVGCTATTASNTNRTVTAASPQSRTSSPRLTGPSGSPGNPLVLPCASESWPEAPAPVTAGPRDLAVGPMYFAGALALATETPAGHGYGPFGRHGRSYKFGVVVRPDATVTVTIGASARGHAVIDLSVNGSERGVTSATYHACRQAGGFYAQGFAFTRPPFRGCVPLDVTVGGQAQVRHVTLSLFAGSCAT